MNTSELNDTKEKMELKDINRIIYHIATEYAFFSAAHETFSKIVNILGHKASINKYKEIHISFCILL
jgi:hypothetical protein